MSGKRRADGPAVTQPTGGGRTLVRRALKGFLVLGVVGALIAVGGFVFLYQSTDIPDPNREFQTETTYVYYDGGGDELGRFASQNRESIPLGEMPEDLKNAVVAAENRSFWSDNGLDPKGILRAAFSNAQGNRTQGASTITQQYVKILYLNQERRLKRKVKEAFLALKVHRERSKSQILEGYLNTIYFGRGAYGVQAAAQAYFNKKAADLNLRESVVLASVLNNPTKFDPDNGKDSKQALKGRFQTIIGGMAEMGTVESSKADQARKKLPKFPAVTRQSAYGGQKGHMLTMVRKELVRLGFTEQEIEGGGLRITTTFRAEAMEAARAGVEEQRPSGFGEELHVGVASVETGTGAVRGFYGGQDFLDSQLNWAVEGGQAGSTLKAFAVAAAIKDGFSLKHTFDGNSPYQLPGSARPVGNQGSRSYGRVNMLRATQDSINTAFIDMTLAMDNGPQKVVSMMNDMGIPPERAGKKDVFGYPATTGGLQANAGVSLGSATVSPINLANGYATIANGGVHSEPYIIEKVVDRFGETRYKHKVKNKRVLDEDIAADVSYALQQVVKAGSGRAAQALGRPAAGKTGTATKTGGAVSSSWFVGYTPQMSTAVMYVRGVGNEQLQGWLPEYFGGAYPARTWTAVMRRLMEGVEVESFPPPANVKGDTEKTGYEPYTPPPPPPKPKKTEEPEVEEPKKPKKTKTPGPTKPPAPVPTPPGPTCGDFFQPPCKDNGPPTDDPTDEPTDEPTDDPEPRPIATAAPPPGRD